MPPSQTDTEVVRWTCDRCEVVASWAADAAPSFPHGWTKEGDLFYCLGCRREMAGEAGVEDAPDDMSSDDRVQKRNHARIEFEVQRDPDRRDNAIAKACHTSVVAVRKARDRLGIGPGGDVSQ
jgi:hypothetical protein